MNIITLDMETYYSDEFSLTKLTTEEYIRSPEFETICCAVKVNDGPTVVLHPSQIREYLLRNNIQESALLCHHTAFDGFILSHHYGLTPKRYLDTLSMARALHGLTISCSLASLSDHYDLGKKGYEVVNAKGKRLKDFKGVDYELYKSYCANDVELTYKLFLKLLEKTPKQELKYISLMLKCYCDPKLVLNKEILDVYAQELESKKEFFLDTLGISEKDLRSDAKFAALLEEHGIDPPTKINKNGEIKFAFAKTDEEFRELEDHPNDTVGMLVAARLGVKTTIESTRAARLQSIATRGKLPIPMSYYGAHTGRPSAWDKINPLNFKKKSPIRTAIEAPKGYLFADCDSAQIEARGNAWFSGQDDLVLAFKHKEDVYSQFATELFNEEVRKPRKEDAPELYQLLDTRRFIGKQCILGFGYQMGDAKFLKTVESLSLTMLGRKVEVPPRLASQAKKLYRNKYAMIKQMWYACEEMLFAIATGQERSFGYGCKIITCSEGFIKPNGTMIRYPNLRQENGSWVYSVKKGRAKVDKHIYGGKVLENIVQSLARDVIMHQWELISKRYDVVMMVYDALGCLVPENEKEEGEAFVKHCMMQTPDWAVGLPLDCDFSIGANYGEC